MGCSSSIPKRAKRKTRRRIRLATQPSQPSQPRNPPSALKTPLVNSKDRGTMSGDAFCVSGGGIRAALVGLVALHELARPSEPLLSPNAHQTRDEKCPKKKCDEDSTSFAIPPNITYGLSGGAWCVLVNEIVGAQKALENALQYLSIDPEKNGLGETFGLDVKIHFLNNWKLFPFWKTYVVNFLLALLADHTTTPPPVSAPGDDQDSEDILADLRDDREYFLLNQCSLDQATSSNIVIGLSNPSLGTENIVVCHSHDQGKIHGASSVTDLSMPPQLEVQMSSQSLTRDNQVQLYKLTRLHQATMSSAAYVAIGTTLDHVLFNAKDVRGLPGAISLADHQFPPTPTRVNDQTAQVTAPVMDVELFDLGVRCNFPITPDQLRTPGTSLVVCASDDGRELFASMDKAAQWWKQQYHFVVEQIESPSDMTLLTWRGLPVTAPDPASALHQFVRFYNVYNEHTKPTGRTIVCITMGRITADGEVLRPSQRLDSLTTTHFGLDGIQPRVFKKPEFDLINTEVRRFYRAVFNALGLGSGTFDIQ